MLIIDEAFRADLHLLIIHKEGPTRDKLVNDLKKVCSDSLLLEQTRNLTEALGSTNKLSVDAIICEFDVDESESLGYETIVYLNNIFPFVPVIIVSSADDLHIERNCLQHGAQDYLGYNELHDDIIVKTIYHAIDRMMIMRSLLSKTKHRSNTINDAITGVCNLESFLDKVDYYTRHAKRRNELYAILSTYLNGFRDVELEYGYDFSIALLNDFVEKIRKVTRNTDVLCRLDVDEFLIHCTNLDSLDGASYIATKIIEVGKNPFVIRGKEIFLSVNIGISFYPENSADSKELVKMANRALLYSRDMENNYQCYSSEMTSKIKEKRSFINKMHLALQNNEFQLYVQPKFDTRQEILFGGESLLRWHSETGIIMPDKIIPVAEETGLIHQIGFWSLEASVLFIIDLLEKQPSAKFKISVNVSIKQLVIDDWGRLLIKLLDIFNVSPDYLELEITESVFVNDLKLIKSTLNQVKDAGISISLDDFGTGYSNLMQLKQLPIDVLKIDRSFIMNMHENESDLKIVRSILAIAQTLNMETIAEGVEEQVQIDLLRNEGCHMVQGYFYDKPLQQDVFLKKYFP